MEPARRGTENDIPELKRNTQLKCRLVCVHALHLWDIY